MGDGSETTESFITYLSLLCCPRSPRTHLGQADSTPFLCIGFFLGSLVSFHRVRCENLE